MIDRKFATPVDQVAGGPSFANAETVAPSDSTNLTAAAAALWIGGAGNVAVVTLGGQTVTFTAVPAGTLLPIACTKVMATNTTATNIVGLW